MKKAINKTNYFQKSFGQFHLCDEEDVEGKEPDFISYNKNNPDSISSEYWYTQKGLYRRSDHWGCVSSCRWFINERSGHSFYNKPILAFCTWESMREIEYFDYTMLKAFEYMSDYDLRRLVIKSSHEDMFLQRGNFIPIEIFNKRGELSMVISYSKIRLIIKS